MSYTAEAPVSPKKAYKRPYKTRAQRRIADRNKYSESRDHKFLWWMVGVAAILLAVAAGFMAKGMNERSAIEAASLPAAQ